ncbi:MAG: RraA family protein [Solirubrobacterales bacterium]|nr:RraA family protein [Solirubrobacterales bacterium]
MPEATSSTASEIRTRFLAVDSANAADVLDALDFPDQGLHPSFTPYPAPGQKLAGWAFTIKGQMTPYSRQGGDPDKMAACAALAPDVVSVWAGGGEGVSFFGELIAIGMKERGCAGAVVDGGVRDLGWLADLDFPVFARYRTPIQSIGRWKVTAWDVPVSLPGATARYVAIEPGDFVLADDDGALVIPGPVVGDVLEKSEAIGRKEREIRADLASGLSLADALSKYGHV